MKIFYFDISKLKANESVVEFLSVYADALVSLDWRVNASF